MKYLHLFIFLIIFGCKSDFKENKNPNSKLENVKYNFISYPSICKNSNLKPTYKIDTTSQLMSEGNILCNTENKIFKDANFIKDTNKFHLFIDTSQIVLKELPSYSIAIHTDVVKNNIVEYYPLFVINLSSVYQKIRVQDNSLFMVQEAVDSNGNWKPIEYWLSSWCGNSYYKKEISGFGYFIYGVYKYSGREKSLCRMKVEINKEIYYSNNFYNCINKEQFNKSNVAYSDYFN